MGNNEKHLERPDWLTLKQVAQRLQVSRTTLWRMQKRGDLPVTHFGSAVRVPRAWLDSLLEPEDF